MDKGKYVSRSYQTSSIWMYSSDLQTNMMVIVDILKLNGNVYAFDSTTIDLCLSTFEQALLRKEERRCQGSYII